MSLRSSIIRLAHDHSEMQPFLLPLLKTSMEHATEEARKTYLKEHPNADPKNHTVGDKPSEKAEAPTAGKVNKFFSGLSGIAKSMVSAVSSAPAKVQSFVMDKSTRKETLSSVTASVKKSPQKVVSSVLDGAKKEVHEIKHAGSAMKKLLTKPRQSWDKADKKAVYGLSLYVVGAVLAGAGGGAIMAAGALGKSFAAHVAAQAMHRLANDGFSHFEAVESVAHMFHLASEDDSEESLQKSMVANLVGAVTDVLDKGISDEEMTDILKGTKEPNMDDFDQPSLKEASLRSAVVRLAHANPKLRGHLLPILASTSVHIAVRDLPATLQSALKQVRYNKRDISVTPKRAVSIQSMGGDGYRAFAVTVDMDSGHTNVMYGSWGGPNMNTRNQVDLDDKDYTIPMNGAVILGSEGGGHPVYASIYVNPNNMAALLPIANDVSNDERMALRIINTIKSSYRADEFDRAGLGSYDARNPVLKSLLAKGLITSRAGGTGIQITTQGKNAI